MDAHAVRGSVERRAHDDVLAGNLDRVADHPGRGGRERGDRPDGSPEQRACGGDDDPGDEHRAGICPELEDLGRGRGVQRERPVEAGGRASRRRPRDEPGHEVIERELVKARRRAGHDENRQDDKRSREPGEERARARSRRQGEHAVAERHALRLSASRRNKDHLQRVACPPRIRTEVHFKALFPRHIHQLLMPMHHLHHIRHDLGHPVEIHRYGLAGRNALLLLLGASLATFICVRIYTRLARRYNWRSGEARRSPRPPHGRRGRDRPRSRDGRHLAGAGRHGPGDPRGHLRDRRRVHPRRVRAHLPPSRRVLDRGGPPFDRGERDLAACSAPCCSSACRRSGSTTRPSSRARSASP